MGFVAGLASDLFLPTPFGLSALVGGPLGFGVGVATAGPRPDGALWLPPVAALAGAPCYELAYALSARCLGHPRCSMWTWLRIVVLVAVTNAVLALPAMRLVAGRCPRPRPRGCRRRGLLGGGR